MAEQVWPNPKEEGDQCREAGCLGVLMWMEVPEASGGGFMLKCEHCLAPHGPSSQALYFCPTCDVRIGVNRTYRDSSGTYRHLGGCESEVEVEFVEATTAAAAAVVAPASGSDKEVDSMSVELCENDEEQRVLDWRIGELLRAGYSSDAATKLALNPSVNLHEACVLHKEKGCPECLALEILL